jgi:hypothetical protein
MPSFVTAFCLTRARPDIAPASRWQERTIMSLFVHRLARSTTPIYIVQFTCKPVCQPLGTKCNEVSQSHDPIASDCDGVQCRARCRPAHPVLRDTLRLCQLLQHRPSFKSRAVPQSGRSAPPHCSVQSLLRCQPRLPHHLLRCTGRRRHGLAGGGGWSSARRATSTSR